MTVQLPFERALSDLHAAAIDAANRWRGHCVERYARLEDEVTRTLTAMAAKPNAKIRVPYNFGDKVKVLRAAIAAEEVGRRTKLANAFVRLDAHHGRRNMLVHATGKIWTDAKGDWLWHYRFQPSAKGSPTQTGYIEKDEALQMEESLARESRSLVDQLKSLRLTLEAATK